MGRATLLLILAAAALQAAPPPGATKAAARFEELVAGGRKEQAELAPLVDELRTLARSYDWEVDAARAEEKRARLRSQIAPRKEALQGHLDALSATLRRFADEHGLETLERLTDERTQGSSDIVSIMRAQTFLQGSLAFAHSLEGELRMEEEAWRRYNLVERERRRFRRILWSLTAAFLAALAAIAYAVRIYLQKRRPPPPTSRPKPGRGGRHGEIIDLRPE